MPRLFRQLCKESPIISHELRTPLTILRGEIEAILEGVRDVRREVLESVHAEVMLLSKTVEDLYTLTIIESESLAIQKERVDVIAVAANILHLFLPRFAGAGIEVQSGLDTAGEALIMGDHERLSQVFSNLYENSLRYTDPPGSLCISAEKRGDAVVLRVEDSAPGVPDSALPLVFDRLYRVDRSRSRKKGGSGLGMAIAKAVVDTHCGEITAAHSALGGLLIEITLPLVKGA